MLFLQGFCGDLRPNIEAAPIRGWKQRLREGAHELVTGTPRMEVTQEAWRRWVASLASAVVAISKSAPEIVEEGIGFSTSCADVPMRDIISGKSRLTSMLVRGLRLGRNLDIVGLGAEPLIGWQDKLQASVAHPPGVRIYAGYLGDVFGYLPLPEQVDEGGYEVTYFQPSFGVDGKFRKADMFARVSAAVDSVVRGLEAPMTN